MDAAQHIDTQAFFHIRMVLSMITSLAVARLLTGSARFVQHPGRDAVYPLHLGWVAFLLVAVIRFWWFEFAMASLVQVTFAHYAFVCTFAALHFLLATMLFPDDIRDYDGYRGYFEARRGWFFGLLALFFATDGIDTWLKGPAYIAATSPVFPWVTVALTAGALVSMRWRARLWNRVYLGCACAAQLAWILWLPVPGGIG